MFSGQIGVEEGTGLTHQQFLEVFSTGNGFTSGCGIEYPANPLVWPITNTGIIEGTDYLSGILRPGRRLLNVKVKRHADGNRRDLQDDFPSTGRFRILAFTSKDLLSPSSICLAAFSNVSKIISRFPTGIIELVVLHPLPSYSFDWKDIPLEIKELAEMRFYNGTELDDAFIVYGVNPKKGAVAVVRPDGYIGIVSDLGNTSNVEIYLSQCLRWVDEATNSNA